ncbi:MAG: amidohydrolase [Bacillota bacterium]
MENIDLLVVNATAITMDAKRSILSRAAIAVKGDAILEIGDSGTLSNKYLAAKTIDATDQFVFPGMIDTHNHLFQVLFKGMGKDCRLIGWLEQAISKPYFNIDEEALYLAAMAGCIEHLKSGSTTVLDYQYCNSRPQINDVMIQVFEDLGIRAVLGRGYTNCNGFTLYSESDHLETPQEFFDDVRRLSKKLAGHPSVDVAIAPGISWVFEKEHFAECARLAKQLHTFTTIHTLETEEDDAFSREHHGMSTLEMFEETGILDAPFLAVHCALVTKRDIELFKAHDVRISYNAISNMMIGYQTMPLKDMLDAGLTVGIAMDGAASNDNQNMLQVLKFSPLWQKAFYRDPSVIPATKVVEMATIDGARAIFKDDRLGSLEAGKKADFFLFDPRYCNTAPILDPVVSLVYGACENNISTTVVGGRVVMENGRIPHVDEQDILYRLQKKSYEIKMRSGIENSLWNQRICVGPFEK